MNNRKQAAEAWKREHPEGITEKNLKEFQAFMWKADNVFRQSNRIITKK